MRSHCTVVAEAKPVAEMLRSFPGLAARWARLQAADQTWRKAGGDLICLEHSSIRLDDMWLRPIVLLSAGGQSSRELVEVLNERCDVIDQIDHVVVRNGNMIDASSIEELLSFKRSHADILPIICSMKPDVVEHWSRALALVDLPGLTLPQALRRAHVQFGLPINDGWARFCHPGHVFDELQTIVSEDLVINPLSLETLLAVMEFRLTFDLSDLAGVIRPEALQYVDPLVIELANSETVIDGGAFTGDTIGRFMDFDDDQSYRLVCVEPDVGNFAFLTAKARGLDGVITFNKALWHENGRLSFEGRSSAGSKVSEEGRNHVEAVPIDALGFEPTLIKLDVEGAERAALVGATRTISRFKPKLAISAYHHPRDISELVALIRSIRDDYRIDIAHHSPFLFETVIYAS